jgi:hypothetical protein
VSTLGPARQGRGGRGSRRSGMPGSASSRGVTGLCRMWPVSMPQRYALDRRTGQEHPATRSQARLSEALSRADGRCQRGKRLAGVVAVHFVARGPRLRLRRTAKHRRAIRNRRPMLLTAAPHRLDLLVSNAVSNGDGLWQQRATFRDTRGHEDSALGQQKRRCHRENGAGCPLSLLISGFWVRVPVGSPANSLLPLGKSGGLPGAG